MNWSALLVLSAGIAAPQETVTSPHFASYTQAYQAAGEAHKPMLVIINPAVEAVSTGEPVTLAQLQADPTIAPVLSHFVVAIVDAGTDHGQEVHRRFGSAALPFAAVIDERREKQIYRSAEPVSVADLQSVIPQYKDGAPVTHMTLRLTPPNDCPNCRKKWMNF
jgi:hypothetical protein